MIFLQFFEHIEAIAANMPNGNPRRLGIFVSNLDQFLAPFLVELLVAQP